MFVQGRAAFGIRSQDVIKEVLRSVGYVVYSIDDEKDWYVSGDMLLASPDGLVAFSDAKGKTQSTYFRIGETEEHGIDYDTWMRYMGICEFRGLKSAKLVVYELAREMEPFGKENGKLQPSGVVLVYDLFNPYRKNTTTAKKYGSGGMVYWRRDECEELHNTC